jgi:hypothetical protein
VRWARARHPAGAVRRKQRQLTGRTTRSCADLDGGGWTIPRYRGFVFLNTV